MVWSGKRVLVTGGGGFIGSHLVERLVGEGARLRAMVHYNALGTWGWLDQSSVQQETEVIVGDLCDRDSVRQAVTGCDTVFHLGALIAIPYSYKAPLSFVRTNIEGTLNVLQAVREADVELLVHTSTSEVYGTARYVPIDEAHPLQGQSPYSASKIAADKMVEAFQLSYGIRVVTVRPFNTYGPRQSARAVIPTIISQALEGRDILLGNLTPTRDFNFVADTVDGFLRAAGCPTAVGHVINLGTGREITIGDLAHMIGRLTDSRSRVVCDEQRLRPAGSEVERLCADNRKARQLLDWAPAYALERGLNETIEWMRGNLTRYRANEYSF
jgi:NAD dependent epimerase/dehydratase